MAETVDNAIDRVIGLLQSDMPQTAQCDKYRSRQHPILQDLDGDLSNIIATSAFRADEEVVNDLGNKITKTLLRETRKLLFGTAISIYSEFHDCSSFKLVIRRASVRLTRELSSDILALFRYISGISTGFPTTVIRDIPESPDNASVNDSISLNDSSFFNVTLSDESPDNASVNDSLSLNDASLFCVTLSDDVTAVSITNTADDVTEESNVTRCSDVENESPDNVGQYSHAAFLDLQQRCQDYASTILDMRMLIDNLQDQMDELREGGNRAATTPLSLWQSTPPQPHRAPKPLCPLPPNMLSPPASPVSNPPHSPSNPPVYEHHLTNVLNPTSPTTSESLLLSKSPMKVQESQESPTISSLLDDAIGNQSYSTPTQENSSGNPQPHTESSHYDLDWSFSWDPPANTGSPWTSGEDAAIHLSRYEQYLGKDLSEPRPVLQFAGTEKEQLLDEQDMIRTLYNELDDRMLMVETNIMDNTTRLNRIDLSKPNGSGAGGNTSRETTPVKSVPAVKCYNKFSPLVDLVDEDCETPIPGEEANKDDDDVLIVDPPTNHFSNRNSDKHKKKEIKVKIIGSSLVRDLGELVDDANAGIRACSVSNPGEKAETIMKLLPMQISDKDEVLVLMAGTNNIPSDPINTCIDKIEATINKAIELNPKRPIIIPEIPNRYDNKVLLALSKIRDVNLYIRDKVSKTANLRLLTHNFDLDDYTRGGLHLSKQGKQKLATSIKFITRQIMLE